MAIKFKGTIESLQAKIKKAGIDGDWSPNTFEKKHTFRSHNGGILNWWESTKRVQFQGPRETQSELKDVFGPEDDESPESESQIFVAHGHDDMARTQLENILHRLKLTPYILMNKSPDGKTIIEALEGQIGDKFKADFGIVLLTPDDCGYPQNNPDEKKPRARQNVVLEMGMILSSLTRARMAIIRKKGELEVPTDLQGIVYLEYEKNVNEVVPKLFQHLKNAGFDISADLLSAAAL